MSKGALNVNQYKDNGKFVEGTSFTDLVTNNAELNFTDNETWPDVKGHIIVNGKTIYISGYYNKEYDFFTLSHDVRKQEYTDSKKAEETKQNRTKDWDNNDSKHYEKRPNTGLEAGSRYQNKKYKPT